MATTQVIRRHGVRLADVRRPMLWAFLGSAAGSVAILFVSTDALEVVIPVVLALIAAYFLFVPKSHEPPPAPRIEDRTYEAAVVPVIGAYDGAFGPGTGSLFALSGVALRALPLRRATAVAKTLNFATNVASLLVFALAGKMIWAIGAVMIVGQAHRRVHRLAHPVAREPAGAARADRRGLGGHADPRPGLLNRPHSLLEIRLAHTCDGCAR
ncbi:hypothetical protein GCM10025876_24910 [Demequina litorisediminis]|uniref:Probable membrane transporter protein n=2 Tax=Demequina litorisediminis TaxID=1849022 RepID=A0ABQ6IGI9_9MICO|nr:hypothetical protein GCM10025876_24910 [Demequina litorisediminis]